MNFSLQLHCYDEHGGIYNRSNGQIVRAGANHESGGVQGAQFCIWKREAEGREEVMARAMIEMRNTRLYMRDDNDLIERLERSEERLGAWERWRTGREWRSGRDD